MRFVEYFGKSPCLVPCARYNQLARIVVKCTSTRSTFTKNI